MSGRKGLSKNTVVDAAVALVEAEGSSALSLSRVARELGVEPPSLYNHVARLDTLRREVALRAFEDLGSTLGRAAMGRAGPEALRAIAADFRNYVRQHPGLYEISTVARPDDAAFQAAARSALEPVMAVLRIYDLDEDDAIHAARALRSALHGFVSLELAGGFGFDVEIDASFSWLVDHLAGMIEQPVARR